MDNGILKSNPISKWCIHLIGSRSLYWQGVNTLTGWGGEELDDLLSDAPSTCLVSVDIPLR